MTETNSGAGELFRVLAGGYLLYLAASMMKGIGRHREDRGGEHRRRVVFTCWGMADLAGVAQQYAGLQGRRRRMEEADDLRKPRRQTANCRRGRPRCTKGRDEDDWMRSCAAVQRGTGLLQRAGSPGRNIRWRSELHGAVRTPVTWTAAVRETAGGPDGLTGTGGAFWTCWSRVETPAPLEPDHGPGQ